MQVVKYEDQVKQLEIKLNNTKKVNKALKEELTKRGDAMKKLEGDLKASQESVTRKEEEVREWATPFKIHTPPAEDFRKVYDREGFLNLPQGVYRIQMELPIKYVTSNHNLSVKKFIGLK